MRNYAKRWLALLLAMVMLFSFTACGNTDSQNEQPQQSQQAEQPEQTPTEPQPSVEEDYDGKLVSDGMLEVLYAKGFTIEKFKGGYRMIRDSYGGDPILVIPEGMSVPTSLESNVQVLQQPVTKSYINGSNIVDMADAIGAAPQVTLVSMKPEKWYIQSMINQMASGVTVNVESNLELIVAGEAQVAVLNGYDETEYQAFRAQNIVVVTEDNTSEFGIEARLEWIKCVGVVYGLEDEAMAYFNDQIAQIEALRTKGDAGVTVGITYMDAQGESLSSRKSGDYQADQVRAAGGIYNLQDVEPDVGGLLNMTPEDFYLRFKDVDVLVFRKGVPMKTVEEVLAVYPSLVDFKAYQTGRIYHHAEHFTQAAADTACIVNDYYTILTSEDPNISTDHIYKMPMPSDDTPVVVEPSVDTPAADAPVAEENYDGKLISDGMMNINYATQFSVEQFKGGYRMITNHLAGDLKTLVVPEGMSVPADLEEGVQVLQLPVTKSYVCASNMVSMMEGIGAIKKVTQIGTGSTTYHFQSINDQLDNGYTVKAGGYTDDVDYELVVTGGSQVVIWNGNDEEVIQKFQALNIPIICEANTSEAGIYGRIEWMKLLGVVYGLEEQALAAYEDQVSRIEAIRAQDDTTLVVAMGGMSASSGKCYSRKSGDFQADYIRYAGGLYALEDVNPGEAGSASLTPEDMYLYFKNADVVIWAYSLPEETLDGLKEVYPAIVDFKAYQNGQIFIQSDSYIQGGAREPACIVEDLNTILTSTDPQVTTEYFVHLF